MPCHSAATVCTRVCARMRFWAVRLGAGETSGPQLNLSVPVISMHAGVLQLVPGAECSFNGLQVALEHPAACCQSVVRELVAEALEYNRSTGASSPSLQVSNFLTRCRGIGLNDVTSPC